MKTVVLIAVSILTLSACSIEKRIHTKGWNVQWNHTDQSKKLNLVTKKDDDLNLQTDRNKEILSTQVYAEDAEILSDSKKTRKCFGLDSLSTLLTNSNKIAQKISVQFGNKGEIANSINQKKHESPVFKLSKVSSPKREIDWELLGNIGAAVLIALILCLALFGSGTISSIAISLITIGQIIITIAAAVCIAWFIWYVFFSWAS